MILKLPDNSLCLGLKPTGLYEVVAPDGTVRFLDSIPTGGSPIDIPVDINTILFSNRPKSFLTELRKVRSEIVLTKKRNSTTRSSQSKGPSHGKRKKKLSTTAQSTLATLGNIDPVLAATLRAALGG